VTTHAPLRSRRTKAKSVYHIQGLGDENSPTSPSKDTRLDSGEQPQGCQMHVRSDSSQSPSASLSWIASYSWWRRERRRCSVSHPTVETIEPLARKVAPLP
jgi:hypothetical protein